MNKEKGILRTSYNGETITKEQVIELLQKELYFYIHSPYYNNLDRLNKYFEGILPQINGERLTTRVRTNKARQIAETTTPYFIGDDFSIVSTYDLDEYDTTLGEQLDIERNKEEQKISKLNKILKVRGFENAKYETAMWCSKVGIGYMLAYQKEGDKFPYYTSLNPLKTFVIYDNSIVPQPVLGVYFNLCEETKNGINYEYYEITAYTKYKVYFFRTTTTQTKIKDRLHYYDIKPLKEEVNHFFGEVPIIQFYNNIDGTGDYSTVIELIDLYCLLQSNRATNIQNIVEGLLLLKNVDFGNEEEKKNSIQLLKQEHILPVSSKMGDNVDVEFLTNTLDQTQVQKFVDNVTRDIEQISGIPDLSSPSFAQSVSGPALKYKLIRLENKTKDKEKQFNKSIYKLLDITNNFLKYINNNEIEINTQNINLLYKRSLPSNDQEMSTIIATLAPLGLINPIEALSQLSFVKDPVESYKSGIEYLKLKQQIFQNNGISELKNNNSSAEKVDLTDAHTTDNFKNYAKSVLNDVKKNENVEK